MSLFVIDIDGSIACLRKRVAAAGIAPDRSNLDAYRAYIQRLMDEKQMAQDMPIPGMQTLLRALASKEELIYLTGRSENYRTTTERWLLLNRFPEATVIMRSVNDWSSAADYKEKEMLKLKHKWGSNITVIDDDYDSDCSPMYQSLGLLHLKVCWGGGDAL